MSVLQATVLLAFNDEQEYSYDALQAKTGLSDTELNIQLISLACLDQKVLLAIPPMTEEEKNELAKTKSETAPATGDNNIEG